MQYARDLTTIEEILSTDEETLNKVLDKTYYDIKPGDFFFIKSKPDIACILEERVNIDGDYYYLYHGGQKVNEEDTLPLFTSGILMDMLRYGQSVEVRSLLNRWLLVFDDQHVYTSEADEPLVSFMWRAIKDLAVKGQIE